MGYAIYVGSRRKWREVRKFKRVRVTTRPNAPRGQRSEESVVLSTKTVRMRKGSSTKLAWVVTRQGRGWWTILVRKR